ncbi:uncharacterized protein LOC124814709 [Hydra vulgaris]|uniref:uncharacterized protein LOC124814709 n=1 Tax=Hydra vulgaris TaxID=6087 RepID=UPI001F5E7E16|nr:uncharacterized protein LOC124814709 [Hydra vulgaris]
MGGMPSRNIVNDNVLYPQADMTSHNMNNDDVLHLQADNKQMASETAQNTNNDDVVTPQPNEENLLADILGDDVKEIKTPIFETGNKLASFVKGSLNLAYLAAKQSKSIDDWVKNGAVTLTSLYELGLGIHQTIKIKEKKNIREERFRRQAIELRRELINMMTGEEPDEQEENFQKASQVYLARYYATYYIDEICYDKEKSKKQKKVRLYPSIKNFEEYFSSRGTLAEKIDSYRKKLVKLNIDKEIPNTKTSYFAYVNYILKKNYLEFVKKERQKEFALKYKLYRAYLKHGEFDEQICCGDQNEEIKTFISILILPGIYYSFSRVMREYKWNRNILKLEEIMRSYLKVESKIEAVVKKKLAIEKLKYYCELTGSRYGKLLLDLNLKELSYEFKNSSCEESFEVAFDLFQKMSNVGIANRMNYVHLNIEYKNI